MDTKKIKEFWRFLKCGWWVVGWIIFIMLFDFWNFLILGIFGVNTVFCHGGSSLFWVSMMLTTATTLLFLYLLFDIFYEDEHDNTNK